MAELGIKFHKLRERSPQKFFPFLIIRFAESTINSGSHISGRSHGRLPPDRILHSPHRGIIICISVLHSRDELVV